MANSLFAKVGTFLTSVPHFHGATVLTEGGLLFTPGSILRAAKDGNLELVKLLLTSGASVDTRNRLQRTPLMLAAMKGHLQVVRALLRAGARADAVSGSGFTALQFADNAGHREIVDEILNACRDQNNMRTLNSSYAYGN